MRRGVCAAVVGLAVSGVPPAVAAPRLANRCFAVSPVVGKVFLKPTGLGTYMLHGRDGGLLAVDGGTVTRARAPGPAAEFALKRVRRDRYRIRSTASKRLVRLRGKARFRFRRSHGCRPYPEAELGARGKPFRGRVAGIADPHVHLMADLRAGGSVISGLGFDRFGITEALGRDADKHGADGGMDITGNLLRSGSPTGTHDVHGWPTFTGWPTFDTYTHQQVYWRWLQRAWLGGLRLVVAQAVEDEPLCNIEPVKTHSCDETDTVELQVQRLRAMQDYIDAQAGGRGRGFFRIVYSPAGARRAITRGQLAVLVGAETSNPFGCDEKQGQPQCTREEIDRGIERLWSMGVRTMFVAHWVDNALGGAALEGGDKGSFIAGMQVSHTGMPFVTGPCPHPGQGEEPAGTGAVTGRQCNTRGLTDLGDYAIRKLMDRGMLIEVDHLSEWARDRVLAIAEERRYPLVSSHTGTGGTWDASELARLFAVGGFAAATLDDARNLPQKILAFQSGSVGLATDTGGFAALPAPDAERPLKYPFRSFARDVVFSPERTGERVFDLNRDGVAHYGLLPDLLALAQQQDRGGEALGVLFGSAERYVAMWERAVRP